MGELRRVYCTFCRQTFLTTDREKCSLCRKSGGLVDPMSPEAIQGLLAEKKAEGEGRPGDLFAKGLRVYRLGKIILTLGVGGVGSILFGATLIWSPAFRANPRQLSFRDAMPGLATVLAGVIMLGLLAYLLVRWVKEWRRAAGTDGGAQPARPPADVPKS